MVGRSDMLLVATPAPALPGPDWSVFDIDTIVADLAHIHPFTRDHLVSLWMFDRATVAPLLDAGRIDANSDYAPVLELGAERARFLDTTANGVYGMASDPLRLAAALAGHAIPLPEYAPPGTVTIEPILSASLSGWLRHAAANGGQPPYYDFIEPTQRYLRFLRFANGRAASPDWQGWSAEVRQLARQVHGASAGAADSTFFTALNGYVGRMATTASGVSAAVDQRAVPVGARAGLAFERAAYGWDWQLVAALATADDGTGEAAPWVESGRLVDAGVVALLKTGRPAEARRLLERQAPLTLRAPNDFRMRLLEAWIARAEAASGR
jgi:hypothetical protein